MEILTLVKANIRARRGQFIGFFILTFFCVASISTFLNVKIAAERSISEAYDDMGVADSILDVERSVLTEEILAKLDAMPDIVAYEVTPYLGIHTLCPEGWDTVNGSRVYNSQVLLQEKPSKSSRLCYPQIRPDLKKVLSEDYVINPGEIYIANGIAKQIKVKTGDRIDVKSENVERTFTIAGIIEEPFASVTIGYKHILVNAEDMKDFYDEVWENCGGQGFDAEFSNYEIGLYKVQKDMTMAEFRNRVNESTGLFDYAISTLDKSDFIGYSEILVNVFSSILIGVAAVLYFVLLVVIGNTISSSIRENFHTLGILKANGFSGKTLRKVYLVQYCLAEVGGIVTALVSSLFLVKLFLRAFSKFTGFVHKPYIQIGATLLIVGGILLISFVTIFLCTGKVNRVSPYEAISGTLGDVSFRDRLNAPISKKMLRPSLALRQITSDKRQYFGLLFSAVVVTILLVFVQAAYNGMNSKNTALGMGTAGELYVYHTSRLTEEEKKELRSFIESRVTIQDTYMLTNSYAIGEKGGILTYMFEKAEDIPCVYKGRQPLYENEIVVGPRVVTLYGKTIGDTLSLTYNGNTFEYLISGLVSTTSDMGLVAQMGLEAAYHIGFEENLPHMTQLYVLENPKDRNEWYPQEKAKALGQEIVEKYDNLSFSAPNTDVFGEQVGTIVNLTRYGSALVGILAVLIIIAMSSSKCFLDEKKQLGIFKAVGFSDMAVRLMFTVRFTIIFALGGLIGSLLAGVLVTPAFSLLFRMFGSPNIHMDFELFMYLIPLLIIVAAAFCCSFLASRKVKKVDVNVLMHE